MLVCLFVLSNRQVAKNAAHIIEVSLKMAH